MLMPNFNRAVLNFLDGQGEQIGPGSWFQAIKGGLTLILKQAIEEGKNEVSKLTGLGKTLDVGKHVVYHYNPVMWVLKPWQTAWDVGKIGTALDKVYTLIDEPGGGYAILHRRAESYPCTCKERKLMGFFFMNQHHKVEYGRSARDQEHQSCAQIVEFYEKQKQLQVMKIAVASTGVGLPFYMIYAAARSVYKRKTGTIHQDRAIAADHLVRSAVPAIRVNAGKLEVEEAGCRRAQALIALLLRELNLQEPKGELKNYPKTMDVLTQPHGSEAISTALSGAIIGDSGSGVLKVVNSLSKFSLK